MRLSKSVLLHSVFATISALAIILIVGEPIWQRLSPPFEIPRTNPRFLAPVDGPFYVHNAIAGFNWDKTDFLSLWFHPLLSVLVSAIPLPVSADVKFWFLSLCFSVGSLYLGYILLTHMTFPADRHNLQPELLLLIPLFPGGLGIATGNPETATLFLCICVILSVLVWKNQFLGFTFGVLAILAKPNALYLVPMLLTYIIWGLHSRSSKVWKTGIAGIIGIIIGWIGWILIVGANTGDIGTYWNLREYSREFVAGDFVKFFVTLIEKFLYSNDLRDQLRYSTALIIPIVSLILLLKIRCIAEVHRIAVAAGYLSVLAVSLYMGNPNKIIVYVTTLPGHFLTYIAAVVATMTSTIVKPSARNYFAQTMYLTMLMLYCIALIVFYILGTALGWYY